MRDSVFRDSGVAWLGQLPSHWKVRKLKFQAEFTSVKVGDPPAGTRYVGLEHIESKTGKFMPVTDSMQTESESTVNAFKKGDVLFGKLRPYLAKAAVADTDGYCSSEILVLRPQSLLGDYLKRAMLLDGFIQTVDASTYGSKMPRADAAFISQLMLPEPPLDEQIAITAYLDAEILRIDRLISEKRKLRHALDDLKVTRITEILTGADCPQTATGNEWIPSIPEGWALRRLKFIGQVRSGVAKGKKYDGQTTVEMPYLRVANVQDGYLDLDEISMIEVSTGEVARYTLVLGDVLMNEGGDYDKLGRGAVWAGQIKNCLHQNHVFAVRLDDVSLSSWLSAITQTAYAKFYFMNNSKQSTNLASINQGNVKEFPVVIPPTDERIRRQKMLKDSLEQIDELADHAAREIGFLTELRSSTITDAVLGRIDVRKAKNN